METSTQKRPSVVISLTGKTLLEETEERRKRALGMLPEEPKQPPAEEAKKERISWWRKIFG
ncbi:MAG: hypothetical protein BZ151_01670 [Desulfobacca sp. 4484_104]|nr:MAG: hypothetical protein BZ151_01670 [Desulfobacca sp. 4484_104]RLA87974.1 MAG: hypothetical protein DRG58_09330 [Deltaproteobacteria bacterium]